MRASSASTLFGVHVETALSLKSTREARPTTLRGGRGRDGGGQGTDAADAGIDRPAAVLNLAQPRIAARARDCATRLRDMAVRSEEGQ